MEEKEIKFKDFTNNIFTSLRSIKSTFDDIEDNAYAKSKEKDNAEKLLADTMNKCMQGLNSMVEYFTRKEHDTCEKYFRKKMNNLTAEAALFSRSLLRPLGYPGDYETMRMIYDNKYEGSTLFGRSLHKYSVMSAHCQAVRNRRELIPKILRDEFKPTKNKKFHILSVACGPAYEVSDMIDSYINIDDFSITLIDNDENALFAAKKKLEKSSTGVHMNITYIKQSVFRLIQTPDLCKTWGKFDYIYSMGLFDYLDDKQSQELIKVLSSILKPEGIILVGNFHKIGICKWVLRYFMDWPLNYRDEKDMISMIPPGYDCTVFYENANTQMFLKIYKKKSFSRM